MKIIIEMRKGVLPPCDGCGQRWQNISLDREVGFHCPICGTKIIEGNNNER